MIDEPLETRALPPARSPFGSRRAQVGLGLSLALACAIGAGATAIAERGRTISIVALTPEPVTAMKDGTAVAVKGTAAELFGNKFILQDGSGRALIDTGRRGEGATLVAVGEPVTVQGRFESGFVHAVMIQHADGRSDTLDPPHRAPPEPPLAPPPAPPR